MLAMSNTSVSTNPIALLYVSHRVYPSRPAVSEPIRERMGTFMNERNPSNNSKLAISEILMITKLCDVDASHITGLPGYFMLKKSRKDTQRNDTLSKNFDIVPPAIT
jgi:hypothetical protein